MELEKYRKDIGSLSEQKRNLETILEYKENILRMKILLCEPVLLSRHAIIVEKYIASISNHLYYDSKNKIFMKIFDVRKGSFSKELQKLSFYKTIENGTHDIDILRENFEKIISLFKPEDLLNSHKSFEKTTFPPKIIASKFLLIYRWKILEDGSVETTLNCKTIRADLLSKNMKDQLSRSLFPTFQDWKVVKQHKLLKVKCEEASKIFDTFITYSTTNDMKKLLNFVNTMFKNHHDKISLVKKTSFKFGL